jgi:hypothetical protein
MVKVVGGGGRGEITFDQERGSKVSKVSEELS